MKNFPSIIKKHKDTSKLTALTFEDEVSILEARSNYSSAIFPKCLFNGVLSLIDDSENEFVRMKSPIGECLSITCNECVFNKGLDNLASSRYSQVKIKLLRTFQ